MNKSDVTDQIMDDILVALTEAFDLNFERKAFFDKGWKNRKMQSSNMGTLMVASGALRKSIIGKRIKKDTLKWESLLPYASIHNYGGEIVVTKRMKRFFWAKFYETAGKVRYKKSGQTTKNTEKYTALAEYYRSLALMRVGTKIKIPQRQFIGNHEEVNKIIEKICKEELTEAAKQAIRK